MKAFVYEKYGHTDVLQLKEIENPIPKDHEVLIKIHAASINSWDWDLLRGEPFIVRVAGGGLSKPIKKIIGCDVAGEVEVIGKNVTKFKKGDAVFGDLSGGNWGGFAEYVCGAETAFTKKPLEISFEQAASLPQAGVMALQGVRDYGKVKPGQTVLINGAAGGVGSFAIQLATLLGAIVTGVDHTSKLEMMVNLGADHVIDYTKEDCTKNGKQYDLILDVIGYHSLFAYRKILNPTGNYRMIGGPIGLILQSAFIGPFLSLFGKKKMGVLAHLPNKGLDTLIEYMLADKIKPIIDRVFPFEETKEALDYFGSGRVKGKVVIRM